MFIVKLLSYVIATFFNAVFCLNEATAIDKDH